MKRSILGPKKEDIFLKEKGSAGQKTWKKTNVDDSRILTFKRRLHELTTLKIWKAIILFWMNSEVYRLGLRFLCLSA